MIDVLFVDLDLFCFHFAVCCCCWSIVGSLIRWVLGVYYLSNTLLGLYFVFVIVFFLRETLCWLFCSCWFTFVFVFHYLRDWFFVWLIFISFVCLNVKVVALSLVVFVDLVLVNFLWWYYWHFFVSISCFALLFSFLVSVCSCVSMPLLESVSDHVSESSLSVFVAVWLGRKFGCSGWPVALYLSSEEIIQSGYILYHIKYSISRVPVKYPMLPYFLLRYLGTPATEVNPSSIYLLKVNNGVVLASLLLTLNIFHTLF